MGIHDDDLRKRYRDILNSAEFGDTSLLRRSVLLNGLPSDANSMNSNLFGRCSLRGLVWKALLGIGTVNVNEYADLVRQGPSAEDSRVREDARRTFSKSDDFTTIVPTEKIIRLLNAYVRACGNLRGIYAQSMSLLAAPFLYVMPEPDAFHCFRLFLREKIPTYVKRYSGARYGCELLDKCLNTIDPQLHKVFAAHNLSPEVYAFPSISSLGACVQPISDTVRLWDIQIGFGVHMHILFTLARLLLARNTILLAAEKSSSAPLSTRDLEQGLGFNSETVLAKAVPLARQLTPELYKQLVSHSISSQSEEFNERPRISDHEEQARETSLSELGTHVIETEIKAEDLLKSEKTFGKQSTSTEGSKSEGEGG